MNLLFQARTEGDFVKFRQYVDESLGVKSHRETISTYMKKGGKVKVQVGFSPKDDTLKTSLFIVRYAHGFFSGVQIDKKLKGTLSDMKE